MKQYKEMNHTEKKEVTALFATWLHPYTHEVIAKVMERRDEIINNEFTMNLLKELKERQRKENEEFTDAMFLMLNYDEQRQYDPHNHPLSHSGSYRDILYDMYIKG